MTFGPQAKWLCDGSNDPAHFEGTRTERAEHQKTCELSEVGGIYRTLAYARAIADALKEKAS